MAAWEHLASPQHRVRLGLKEKERGWHNPQEPRLLSFRNKHICWRGWRRNHLLHVALVEPGTWGQASSGWQGSGPSLPLPPKGTLPEGHWTLRGDVLQLSRWSGALAWPKSPRFKGLERESKQDSGAFISVKHYSIWLKDPLLVSVVEAMHHTSQTSLQKGDCYV